MRRLQWKHAAAYPNTRFGTGSLAAAETGYRFQNGFGVGVRVEQARLNLTESTNELGRLRGRFFLAEATYQLNPRSGSGVGGHFHAGAGLALTNFQKGPAIREIEQSENVRISVETHPGIAGVIGGGVDLFLARHSFCVHDRFQLFRD